MAAVGLACTFLAPEHQQGGSNGTSPSARPRLFTFIQNRSGPTFHLPFAPPPPLSRSCCRFSRSKQLPETVSPFLERRREAFRGTKFWRNFGNRYIKFLYKFREKSTLIPDPNFYYQSSYIRT